MKLKSVFNKPVNATLISAYYDENGKLIGIDDSSVTLNDDNGYKCSVTKDVMYNMMSAKTFLFDSYNRLIPMTDNVIIIRR